MGNYLLVILFPKHHQYNITRSPVHTVVSPNFRFVNTSCVYTDPIDPIVIGIGAQSDYKSDVNASIGQNRLKMSFGL